MNRIGRRPPPRPDQPAPEILRPAQSEAARLLGIDLKTLRSKVGSS